MTPEACGQAVVVVSRLVCVRFPRCMIPEHNAYLQAGMYISWCLAAYYGRSQISLSGLMRVTLLSLNDPIMTRLRK